MSEKVNVEVRTATLTTRTTTLSKPLLRQFRKVTSVRRGWYVSGTAKLVPEHCMGWFMGTVLGEEYTRYVLFQDDGDYFLFSWPGFKPERWCKQLYIE